MKCQLPNVEMPQIKCHPPQGVKCQPAASCRAHPQGDGQAEARHQVPSLLLLGSFSKAHQRQRRERGQLFNVGQPAQRQPSSVILSITALGGSEKLPLGFGGFFFSFPVATRFVNMASEPNKSHLKIGSDQAKTVISSFLS